MNSRAFSWALIVVDLHSLGKEAPLSPEETWISLKMNRPHWLVGWTPTGVLKVMYCGAWGMGASDGYSRASRA